MYVIDTLGMQGQSGPHRGKRECKSPPGRRSLACLREIKKPREPEEEQYEVGSDRETRLCRSWSGVHLEKLMSLSEMSLFSPSLVIIQLSLVYFPL